MTHTPGPWRPHFYERNKRTKSGNWIFTAPDMRYPTGDIVVYFGNSNTGKANARLAASAPDLLAAAEYVVQFLSEEYPQLTLKKRLQEAIAKATRD